MDRVVYECTGTVNAPLCWEKYEWTLKLFENRVEIVRNGRIRVGGPAKENTIYFDDVTSVVYGTLDIIGGYIDSWIVFIVPGAQSTNGTMSTANITGNFSLSSMTTANVATDPQWENTHAVIRRDKKGKETLKPSFEIIREQYNKYKQGQRKTVVLQSTNPESAYDKLKKLKELQEMGIISSEEYEEKRKILLADL